MRKFFTILCIGTLLAMASGTAMAESIKNRFGITGRVGFIVPSDSTEVVTGVVGTNVDVIGGGGLIYGVTDHVAAELDITHAGFGSGAGVDFEVTNITLGAQYRFTVTPNKNLVPYVGGGLDILINDANQGSSVDDVVGVHVSGGVDYFVHKQVALTAEAKGVVAPDADIRGRNGQKIGDFDPVSFSMTFGVRYFFN